MAIYSFDGHDIRWNQLEGIEHLHYSILDINTAQKTIDVLFKFAAGRQIVLHRHKVLNHMLVLEGEHRLYHTDGTIKEIRPAGRYTISPASEEPHREGGGDGGDAVVLFSIRGSDGALYEILDEELNLLGTLGMRDFVELFEAQQAT